MLPSTIPLTWPTRDELDDVLGALEQGMREYDRLSIRLQHLLERDHNDSLPDGVPPPTLEDIGALACFVELARLDLSAIEGFAADAARTYKRAAYHVSYEETSVDA